MMRIRFWRWGFSLCWTKDPTLPKVQSGQTSTVLEIRHVVKLTHSLRQASEVDRMANEIVEIIQRVDSEMPLDKLPLESVLFGMAEKYERTGQVLRALSRSRGVGHPSTRNN